jgi:peptidoglycan/xylan/chitin deacetylase (PgdA/CDA1 family)
MKKIFITFRFFIVLILFLNCTLVSCVKETAYTSSNVENTELLEAQRGGSITKTFSTTNDAYVYGSATNTNYGSATTLLVKRNSSVANLRKSFLKFNLTDLGIANITSAKIRLYATAITGSCNVSCSQTTDNWSASTISYANCPTTGSTLQSVSVTRAGVYYEWDVTSFVKSCTDVGDFSVSFVMSDLGTSNQIITFNSNEATANKPQLLIKGTAGPVIIFKFDNLEDNTASRANFLSLTRTMTSKGLKGAFGIVGNSLEDNGSKQSYYNLVKSFNASGNEIFFHGYDHLPNEFEGTSYNHQYYQVQRTLELLSQKCQITCKTMNCSFNHGDATTVSVVNNFTNLKAWLIPYGCSSTPLFQMSERCDMEANYVINYNTFINNYNDNIGKDYLVVQGHPTHWNTASFNELYRIMDVLKSRGSIFMTPNEYFLNR